MERRTFEDSLKDAFRDAEATPSEQVWTNVELELERSSGGSMRRRVLFYQLLAAAAVTLALLASGVAYMVVQERDQTIERLITMTQQERGSDNGQATGRTGAAAVSPNGDASLQADAAATTPADAGNGLAPQINSAEQRQPLGTTEPVAKNHEQSLQGLGQRTPAGTNVAGASSAINHNAGSTTLSETTPPGNTPARTLPGEEQRMAYTRGTPDTTPGVSYTAPLTSYTAPAGRGLPPFYSPVIGEPSFDNATAADPIALMMSRLAEEELKFAANEKQQKDFSQEKVWTALGVAAGGFSAVNQTSTPVQRAGLMAFANTQVPDKQARASGATYSMGLSFGAKVATRWVIQGGLNYLTQSSNYIATNVVAAPDYQFLQAESINALGKLPALAAAADQLAPTVPYSVNNNLKFFSVPMQAGYLVVNRKFGVQVNAGVSTDLFLENTITPQGGSLDKTTQGSGADSPYRTVNFSGLMGTEFSYRLGQRYRVAINPALRYPFSSVYKSDVGIESMPLTFDVGLRFRYIFK